MKKINTAWGVLVLLLTVIITPVRANAADWKIQYPELQGEKINAVWAASDTYAVAVGDNGLILTYNGSSWVTEASPTSVNLNAVFGTGSADVWAVGDYDSTNTTMTAVRWDGVSWTAQSGLPSLTADLYGVWVDSVNQYVFAVGTSGTVIRCEYAAAPAWYDETAAAVTDVTLRSIYGISESNIWAVGDYQSSQAQSAIIQRVSGVWNFVSTGSLSPPPIVSLKGVYAVDFSAYTYVFAVGEWGELIQYNGSTYSWSRPTSLTSVNLNSVSGVSDSDVWAVGDLDGVEGAIIYYDGSSWTLESTGVSPSTLTNLYGVSTFQSGGQTYVLTGGAYETLLYRYWDSGNSQMAWESQGNTPTGVTSTFNAIWKNWDSTAYAVGNGGVIAYYDGVNWSVMNNIPAGFSANLYAVWGTDTDNVWAAGQGGALLHYKGVEWVEETSNTIYQINALWGASDSDIWGATSSEGGVQSDIIHYDGISWTVEQSGAAVDYYDIWGGGSDSVFFVGAGGSVKYWDGSAWQANSGAGTNDLFGVWGSGATDVYVVGTGGIYHSDGGTDGGVFTSLSYVPAVAYNAIWGGGSYDLFAAGDNGKIVYCDGGCTVGENWSEMTGVPVSYNLYGIWGGTGADVFAVGGSGIILHYGLDLKGVWGYDDGGVTKAYAVGAEGVKLFFDGSNWNSLERDSSYSVNDIWGTAYNSIYTVTEGMAVYKYDGSIWSQDYSGDQALNGIWADSSTGQAWAVGENGAVYWLYPPNWTPLSSSGTENFRAVWGTDATNVFVGGDDGSSGGVIYNSTNLFSPLSLPATPSPIYGLSGIGTGTDEAYAVGDVWTGNSESTILGFDGSSTWSTVSTGLTPDDDLRGVWTVLDSGYKHVFAVGEYGTVLHYNGETYAWSDDSLGISRTLNDVWGLSPRNYFIVGDEGTLYRNLQYRASVGFSGVGSGQINFNPPDHNYDSSATAYEDYDPDTQVTLTPIPDSGSSFYGWSGDCSSYLYGTATLAMDADKSCTAVFESNNAPIAAADSYSTTEDADLTEPVASGVLSNDNDSDPGDALTVSAADSSSSNGVTVTVESDGSFTYSTTGLSSYQSLASGDSTTDSFSYTASDGNGGTDTATVSITINGVNDAPTISNVSKTGTEDTTLSFSAADFTSQFTEVDSGDSLKVVEIVSLPANGTLKNAGSAAVVGDQIASANLGNLTFEPTADWNGSTSFSWKASDQSDAFSSSALVNITIDAVNDAPTISDVSKTGTEDTTLSFSAADFTSQFTEVDSGDSLKVVEIVSLPVNGTLKNSGTAAVVGDQIASANLGNLTFEPTADWNGSTSFSWKASDQSDAFSSSALVNITIDAVNDAPTISNVSKTGTEDTTLSFSAADFTSQFTEVDSGDSLKVVEIVSLPANGTLKNSGTAAVVGDQIASASLGNLTFEPTADWNGSTSFSWKASDQSDAFSSSALVNITIDAVNDAPTISNVSKTGTEDTTLSFSAADFTSQFTEVDSGDSLKVVEILSLPGNGTLKNAGAAVVVNDQIAAASLGNLTFEPTADWTGSTSFSWKASDQSDAFSSSALVNITIDAVNDAPTISNVSKTGTEDTTLSFSAADFTSQFTEVDSGDSLKVVEILSLPGNGTLKNAGAAAVVGDQIASASLGNLTFEPTADWNGSTSFSWKASDQSDAFSSSALVNITIDAVNDAPTISNVSKTGTEDTTLSFSAADFTSQFTEVDSGDSLKVVEILSLPGNGTLKNAGAAAVVGDQIASASLGNLTFEPTADWNGSTSFSWKASDQSDAFSSSALVNITIDAVNDAPTISNVSKTGTEDTTLSFSATDFTGSFSDVDSGDSLKVVEILSLPGNGTLKNAGAAVVVNDQIAAANLGNLTFEPTADWNGSTSFSWKASDQSDEFSTSALVNITIDAVNDAPTISNVSKTGTEDTTLSFSATDFTGSFSDVDSGDSLKVVEILSLPGNGTLKNSGAAAVVGDQIASANLGNLTFEPTADWTGSTSFSWKASDQSDEFSTSALVNITIDAVNDAPTISNVSKTGTEDTTLSFSAADFTSQFTEVDSGDSLKVVEIGSLPSNGTLKNAGAAAVVGDQIASANLGNLTFEPTADWTGSTSFSWKASDQSDEFSTSALVNITIDAVNDAPTISNVSKTGTEDTTLAFSVTDFTGAFSDVDSGDSLKVVEILSLPGNGTLKNSGAAAVVGDQIASANLGNLTFEPTADWTGSTSFSWKASDQSDEFSTSALVNITIDAVNDAPTITNVTKTGSEDTTLAFSVTDFTGAFSDVDSGDSLKVVEILSLPGNGTLKNAGAAVVVNEQIASANLGNLTFEPTADWTGSTSFSWKASDQSDEFSTSALVNITIDAVNDAPTITNVTKTGSEDTTLAFSVTDFTGAFSDVDSGDSLKVVEIVSLPSNGTLKNSGAAAAVGDQIASADLGNLTFEPTADWTGSISFSWKASDQSDEYSASALVNITINASNDAPTISDVSKTGTEDTTLAFSATDFTGAFSDVDTGDSLKVVEILSLPSNGTLKNSGTAAVVGDQIASADLGNLVFEPTADWTGSTSFNWKASDQSDEFSASALVNITINASNDAPTVTNVTKTGTEDTTLAFSATDFTGAFSDVDTGDSLKVVEILSLPANGTLKNAGAAAVVGDQIASADLGNLTFEPAADWTGSTSFSWKASDQSDEFSASALVNITINASNDAPTISDVSKTGTEDTTLAFSATDFTGAFSDVDTGDSLKVVEILSLPSNGTLKNSGTAAAVGEQIASADLGNLTFEPTADWTGSTSFSWKASDQSDEFSTSALVNITIDAVNDAPTITNVTKTGSEDTTLSFIAADFTSQFTEVDSGDSLKVVEILSLPGNGTLKNSGAAAVVGDQIASADLGNLTFEPTADWTGSTSFSWKASDQSDEFSASALVNITINASNDAPTISDVSKTGTEDTTLAFSATDFTGAFSDVDSGDSLKVVEILSLPGNGTLKNSGTAAAVGDQIASADLGNLAFEPTADWTGSTSFSWKASDQSDEFSASALVNITINASNDAPTVTNITKTGTEDTTLAFSATDFTGAFSDVDSGDSLKVVEILSLPGNGTLKNSGAAAVVGDQIAAANLGNLTVEPTADWAGSTSFSWKASDQSDEFSTSALVNITIDAVNDAPTISNVSKTGTEDTTLAFSATDFTGAFSDVDSGDSLKVVEILSLPSNGTLKNSGTAAAVGEQIASADLGNLTFEPTADWTGSTSFNWKASDQSDEFSASALVNITINASNDAPTVTNVTKTGTEDTTLAFSATDFTGAFSDVDTGDSLKVVEILSLPANGTLKNAGAAAVVGDQIASADLGNLTFEPAADWTGSTSFSWKASDQSDEFSASALVNITINASNDAPTISDVSKTGTEDATLAFSATDFTGAFSDVDTGDSLKVVEILSLPGNGTLKNAGSAAVVGDQIASANLGSLTFEPTADWTGSTSFSWKASDQSDEFSASALVNITINASNDAPTISDVSKTGTEDATLAFSATDFTGAFSDVDTGDSLKVVEILSLPSNGTLKNSGTAAVVGDQIAAANLGNLTVEPTADWAGSTSFSWKASDQSDEFSTSALVNITIDAVNDAPTISNVSKTGTEDTTLAFSATDFTGAFSDVDSGDSLKVVEILSLPSNGTLKNSGTAAAVGEQIASADLGNLTFEPTADWTGSTSFNWKASDQSDEFSASALVNITINASNDAPTVTNVTKTGTEDTTLAFSATDFTGAFSDVDTGDSLKVVEILSLPSNGTLKNSGAAAVVGDQIASADLGNLAFEPTADWTGSTSFSWKASDQSDEFSASALVNITINASNDAPTVTNVTKTGTEDTTLAFSATDFTGAFSDVDTGDSLKVVEILSLPSNGTLKNSGTAAAVGDQIASADLGNLAFEPTADWTGSTSFSWKASDQSDEFSASALVNITINASNDAPTISDVSKTGTEDATLAFSATDFTGAFSDVDSGDSLKVVEILSLPANGTLKNAGAAAVVGDQIASADLGNLAFEPTADWTGSTSFSWKASDQSDEFSASALVNITINSSNDAPTISDVSKTGTEDTTLAFSATDFTGAFSDVDTGDSLKVVEILSLPANGTLKNAGAAAVVGDQIASADLGNLAFEPTADWTGSTSFSWKASDQSDEFSASALVNITINASNDAPTVTNITKTGTEDTTLAFSATDFTGAFSDVDTGDSLKVVEILSLPSNGTLKNSGTAAVVGDQIASANLGSLTFEPTADWTGSTSFSWKASDQSDEFSASALVNITINASNDAPTVTNVTKTGTEDTTLAFSATDFTGAFSDVDSGDSLKVVEILSLPGNGTLKNSGTAAAVGDQIASADLGNLAFEPTADWTGSTSFSWKASDQSDELSASALVNITINASNDAPTVTNVTKTGTEDTTLAFSATDFTGAFSDVDTGDSLKVVEILSLPSNGTLKNSGTAAAVGDQIASADLGNLTFEPTADWTGSTSFSWKASDQSDEFSASALVNITINASNDAPTVTNVTKTGTEDTTLAFSATDFTDAFSDVDSGDSLKVVEILSLPGNGTLKNSGAAAVVGEQIASADLGNLTFEPMADWTGSTSFSWKASDQSDEFSASALVNITINASNDAPTISDVSKTGTEDATLAFSATDFTGAFSDVDSGDSLKVVEILSLPANGTLKNAGAAAVVGDQIASADLGNLVFEPTADWTGSTSFNWKASDQSDEFSASALVNITITAVNDAPTATGFTKNGFSNIDLYFTEADFADSVSDPDSGDGPVRVEISSLPDSGILFLESGGSTVEVAQSASIDRSSWPGLFFRPEAGWHGQTSFEWKAYDSGGAATNTVQTVLIISSENTPPTADAGPDQEVVEGAVTVTLDGSGSRSLRRGIASYQWTQVPETGVPSVALSNQGQGESVTFVTPAVSEDENLNFELKVTDTEGIWSTDTVVVTVRDNGLTHSNFPSDALAFSNSVGSTAAVMSSGGQLVEFKGTPPAEIPFSMDKPTEFLTDVLNLTLIVDEVGGTVELVFYLDSPAPEGYKWMKYLSASGTWLDFSAGVEFNSERTQATVRITDGGDGDEDGEANGVVVDPAGLGQPPAVATQDIPLSPGDASGDFKIIALSIQTDSTDPEQVLGGLIGEYDSRNMRIGFWDSEVQAYTEYPFEGYTDSDGEFIRYESPKNLFPGWACWALFRNGADLEFEGTVTRTPENSVIPDGTYGARGVTLTLYPGWNQIGVPYLKQVNVGDIMVYDGENGTPALFLSSQNQITDPVFWIYDNGEYKPMPLLGGATLYPGQGGWVKKNTAGVGRIFFPAESSGADYTAWDNLADVDIEDLERPPAPPDMGSGSFTLSAAPVKSKESGCFISVMTNPMEAE